MNYKYWTSSRTENVTVPENEVRPDLEQAGFLGDSVSPPKGYFDNFKSFQTTYNSFENQRNALFSQSGSVFSAGKLI